MRRLMLITIMGLLVPGGLICQKQLSFGLYDVDTKAKIPDAHAFIVDTEFGTASDKNGIFNFEISDQTRESLIISHVSYHNKVLSYTEYEDLNLKDSIFLEVNGLDLSAITISGKRDNKWKKNLKKFTKAFIGSGKEAKQCKILNPEVLRFENTDEYFKVTAVDIIKIKNDYLEYEIDFLLNSLVIDNDGSSFYHGYPKFKDFSSSPQIEEVRQECYEKNTSHFYYSLISNQLKENGYEISIKRYVDTQFELISKPEVEEVLRFDSLSQLYYLSFPDFLEVRNLNIKDVIRVNSSGSISSAEQQKFGSMADNSSNSKITFATSMLYKTSPFLVLDRRGNLINKKNLREYGFWADRKIATLLPIDLEKKNVITQKPTQETVALDTLGLFRKLFKGSIEEFESSIDYLDRNWKDEYAAPLIEIIRVINTEYAKTIFQLFNKRTETEIANYYEGLEWLWKTPQNIGDYYSTLKGELYQHIDSKFNKYFDGRSKLSNIRLDEVVWGGVEQDGIPPLRFPKMISVEEAGYLNDDDVVFGIVINGEAKAYPKRILAWHEFFVDHYGEDQVAGVYCTLCGTVIAYNMKKDNVLHDLGTSGFLYRSNKLMYDQLTQSLWSTIEGKPVVGPLVNQRIELDDFPVVTTSWKNWKASHPQTLVLDIDTGHKRNYNEGEAYRQYFDNDNLMFPVPKKDTRLRNKAEVFVIRSNGYKSDPLAISVDYLKANAIHFDSIAGQKIVVLTEPDGLARAYLSKEIKFEKYQKGKLIDDEKKEWSREEEFLVSKDGIRLERISGHNIFWFAWYNNYPNTRLIK